LGDTFVLKSGRNQFVNDAKNKSGPSLTLGFGFFTSFCSRWKISRREDDPMDPDYLKDQWKRRVSKEERFFVIILTLFCKENIA
jgi:hypothetical protein